jgi:hypothetical protein
MFAPIEKTRQRLSALVPRNHRKLRPQVLTLPIIHNFLVPPSQDTPSITWLPPTDEEILYVYGYSALDITAQHANYLLVLAKTPFLTPSIHHVFRRTLHRVVLQAMDIMTWIRSKAAGCINTSQGLLSEKL